MNRSDREITLRKKAILREKAERDRARADQGEFFFASVTVSSGVVSPHPVFILGKHGDSNDRDVIVCLCTKESHGKRSKYDILVELKHPTYVRTNKIYLVDRSHLQFKIDANKVTPQEIETIKNMAVTAIS
ncbi:hypothetical protein [Paenibacillus campi]|uniref:hypothetical protein n=1 Tax=Paenibacillus campi TaxID=3106031 RepID=UPI002AFFD70B|nr:hypothetical protein [Paenibacillus sp. SGZ-1014]